MKKLLLTVLSIWSLQTFSQSKNYIDQNYIEVEGTAEMEITPDEIYLQVIIDEKDFKNKSLEELEKGLMVKLQNLIDLSSDLKVIDMTSNFKNYWIKSNEIKSRKEFQIKVGDANTAGNVFRELESIGISKITIEQVQHSKIIDFKEQVKILAMKAAKQKATSLATAIDQHCGRAIFIQELTNNMNTPLRRYKTQTSNIVISSNQENSSVDVEFETIKLEYSILARFELD